jgi:GNAT superfamily N-acetyltransferase
VRAAPELLAEIQEAASLAGLGHIYPPDLHPYPREAVLERWRGYDGEVFLDPDGRGFSAIGDGWLNGLYVRPEAWGTGVAGELHDRAVEALHEAGAGTARLWVLQANVRARRFYERRGWTPDGSTREVEFPPYPLDVGYSLTLRPPTDVA